MPLTASLLGKFTLVIVLCATTGFAQASPDSFESVSQAASADREAGRAEAAIRQYRKAVDLKPEWSEGWWYLGTLLYDANRFADAKTNFAKVVELLPNLGSAWDFLGLCEYETKEYAPAREHLEKGHTLGSADDPEVGRIAAYHLALLRIRSGDFDSASSLLDSDFPGSQPPDPIKIALGLAVLHVPLLPGEVDPAQESLLLSTGAALRADTDTRLAELEQLEQKHPSVPYLHYAHGNALASMKRFDEAILQYKLETQIAPGNELPWVAISRAELQASRNEPARRAAETAVKLAPQSKAAHLMLAEVLQAGGHANSARERTLAESLSNKRSQPGPKIADLYRNKQAAVTGDSAWKEAMLDFSNARYGDAVELLKPWVQANPNDGTAWAVLGLSEFRLKDYDNALVHLQRGHALGFGGSPESVQVAFLTLGVLLNHTGQFENSMSILVSAPSEANQETQIALGMALLRMTSFPDEVDPDLRPIVRQAGKTAELLHTSQYDQAFANFDAMLRQSPTLPFLHYAYGTALIAMSRYDEATAQMNAESKISPKSELPFVRLASIAIRQHRATDARQAAEQALTLNLQSGEAHYLLGRARLELGDPQGAIAELEIAGRTAPNSPEIHFNLAKAYTRAQLTEKAEGERAIFVRLNAAAEKQKAHGGTQSYEGPRESSDLQTESENSATPH